MRTTDSISFTEGDWVVHCHHGIGQIEAIERKEIGEQAKTYFRIKMADSVIWMPVRRMESEQIRPIISKTRFQAAVKVLGQPPKRMASNLKRRKARIKQVTANNLPKETAGLIRDLRARRREKKGLNQSERQALRDLTNRFLQEWSVCIGLTMGQARRRLDRQLQRRQAATRGQPGTAYNNPAKRGTSPVIDALARRDDKWSEWLNKQLVKGM